MVVLKTHTGKFKTLTSQGQARRAPRYITSTSPPLNDLQIKNSTVQVSRVNSAFPPIEVGNSQPVFKLLKM